MSELVKRISIDEEYKKKTGITREDIAKFREWLKTQPHLPEEEITDIDLILTYNCCGLSSAVSKQVLDLNITLRTLFTNLFKDRYVNDRTEFNLKNLLITPLEKRTKEGYAAYYVSFVNKEPKNFVFSEAVRTGLMVIDLWQYEDGTWPGMILIFDLIDMSLGHLARLDIQTMQQFLYYLQEAMLINLKGLHILNAPVFMDKLMMLMKPFMKKELLDMFHIHVVGSKAIEPFYPMENLPKDTTGGNYRTYNELQDEIMKKMKANKNFFMEENKKRVVESRRPGRPKTISDIFGGMEGTFKKLEID